MSSTGRNAGAPALGLAILWLALAFSLPAQAQDASPPIPAAEIASRTAEVAALLANVESLSAPGPEMQAIEQELPEKSKRLQERWQRLPRRLANEPSAPALQSLAVVWQTMRTDLNDWSDSLEQRGNALQRELKRLSDLDETWARSLKEFQAGQVPPQLIAEINGLRDAIQAARARVNARLAEVLVLEYRISAEQRRADQALAMIAQARSELFNRLGVRNAPPIWNPELWAKAQGQFVTGFRGAGVRWWNAMSSEWDDQARRVVLHGIGFLVLLALLLQARRQIARWNAADRRAGVNWMLHRPVSAALALAVFASPWVYPTHSFAVFATSRFVSIFPATRLLLALIPAGLSRALYAFAAVFALDAVRPMLFPARELEQMLLLVNLLAGGLLVGWMWLAVRRAVPGTETRPAAGDPSDRSLAVILAVTLLVAFVAGAAGYLQLTRLLATAAVRSAYAWLAIRVVVWLLLLLVAYLLWARPLGALASVQRNRAYVEGRASVALTWIGFVAWLFVPLSAVTVSGDVFAFAGTVLNTGVGWGAVQISLGDVLLFGATAWAAFTLSSVVRAMLEGDVFPRVRLAEGVPLALANLAHYAILLVGFVVALTFLGVDLTKVTILVGAFGVGVGFGLQTVVNNFASGLILLFERPIRVGDVVQVGDIQGEVRHIGIRASTVRTWRGADVFIPNAQLVTEKVTNWTYTDRRLRIDLRITAAAGSDPARVKELVCGTARSHPDVLREPPPAAFSLGFGDSGLTFDLRVWTNRFERSDAIRSELAEAVSAALSEAKIGHTTVGGTTGG
jgi:potassium-dependent mechanosensitive channel